MGIWGVLGWSGTPSLGVRATWGEEGWGRADLPAQNEMVLGHRLREPVSVTNRA